MAAAVSAAATATAARTLLGNVHPHRAPFVHGAVELRDGVGRVGLGLHRDEGEASGAPSLTIHHHVEVGDLAAFGELAAEPVRGDVVRKVADVKTTVHGMLSLSIFLGLPRGALD